MEFSARAKFWFVVVFILIAGFVGGILGNWIFIYLLDKYYGIPGGNYLVAPNSADVIIHDSKDSESTSQFTQTVNSADSSLVGIFKKQTAASPLYLPKDKVGQGLIMTSDGWVFTPTVLPETVQEWNDYVVIANDRTVYAIDRVITDDAARVTFVHLQKASNLPVKDYLLGRELTFGQVILGLEWKSTVEAGTLSRISAAVLSSDAAVTPLAVSGLGDRNLYLFDASGRIIGYTVGRTGFAMDTVKGLLDKILADGTIQRSRLGINYLNLSGAASGEQTGALIAANGKEAAIVAGSPAERSGLRSGDIITGFDGVAINQFTDIATLLLDYNPGDTIVLDIVRRGVKQQLTVTLDKISE